MSDFILGGSKITADGDCSHEIKRHLLLGRKVMTNLDSIFKSRDITLPIVCLVKAMVFPVMYGCFLCSQRWRSSIQSTKTRPGADYRSDHELLIAKFRTKYFYVFQNDHRKSVSRATFCHHAKMLNSTMFPTLYFSCP